MTSTLGVRPHEEAAKSKEAFKNSRDNVDTHTAYANDWLCRYNDVSVNADSLFSYFEYKLKKNNINPKPVRVEYEGEYVYDDYPPDIFFLSEGLEKILKETPFELENAECEEKISTLYKTDFDAQIAKLQKDKALLEEGVAKTVAQIEELKTDIKSMRESLKSQRVWLRDY